MKLLRVGVKENERPAILDKNEKIRDLSSQIKDLNPDNLNFETHNVPSPSVLLICHIHSGDEVLIDKFSSFKLKRRHR